MLETPIIIVLVLLAIVAVLWWVYRWLRRIGSRRTSPSCQSCCGAGRRSQS